MVNSSNNLRPTVNEENPLVNEENVDKNDLLSKLSITVRAAVLSLLLSMSIPSANAGESVSSNIDISAS